MRPAFNEYGVPNDDVNSAADKLNELVSKHLHAMVEEGYTASEIRAVGGYFSQAVVTMVSSAIFAIHDRVEAKERENADPNLSNEEKEFAKRAETKIRAIRTYRERTGFGLRESKDAVEAWMLTKFGTKQLDYVQAAAEHLTDVPDQTV